MGNNKMEYSNGDSFVNNDEVQTLEDKVNDYKQEIKNYLEKMVKYQKLSKIMLFAGLIIVALSLVLSSYFPYTKIVTKNIEFQEYSQSLDIDAEAYIDVVSAIPIGTVIQTQTYGAAELSSIDVGYFMIQDTNGNEGIVEIKGKNDISSFSSQLVDNSDSIRFYGVIVDCPDSINLDYEGIISEALGQGTESEDSVQAFNDAYENANENRNSFTQLLEQYKILSCDLEKPMTKEVKYPGIGVLFLIIAGCFFITRFFLRHAIIRFNNKIKNIGVMINNSRLTK